MTLIAELLVLIGAGIAVLAGVGILRFETPYARFHAAGKASPVAFIVTALGAAFLVDDGVGMLIVSALAMTITLPIGVHLLFRAAYRTSDNTHLERDDLAHEL